MIKLENDKKIIEFKKSIKVIKKIFFILLIFIILVCSIWKINGIARVVTGIKKEVYDYFEEKKINKIDNEALEYINNHEKLEDEYNAWYTKYTFISHSGGGIDGKEYTNAKEAYENSYKNGNRVFDADIRFTSDHVLVIRHEWTDNLEQNYSTEIPDYEEFINTPIYSKYTSMSFEDLINFMKKYDDVYIACDAKGDLEEVYKEIIKIVNYDKDILDRLIITFYSYEDYYKIKKVYDFKNWIIKQYINDIKNIYELTEFCLDNNIHVVNIKQEYVNDEIIELLKSKNIKYYVAVEDSLKDLKEYLNKGFSGAVTNYLYENDLKYIKK